MTREWVTDLLLPLQDSLDGSGVCLVMTGVELNTRVTENIPDKAALDIIPVIDMGAKIMEDETLSGKEVLRAIRGL